MKAKDSRLKQTNEILQQIKLVKLNAWEEYFFDKLDKIRDNELFCISKSYLYRVLSIFSIWTTPILIINATFGWLTFQGIAITATKAFMVISIFQILREPIRSVPQFITTLIETKVSVDRIYRFLTESEINNSYFRFLNEAFPLTSIEIKNAVFCWEYPKEADQKALAHPEQRGSLIEFAGKIGKLVKKLSQHQSPEEQQPGQVIELQDYKNPAGTPQ